MKTNREDQWIVNKLATIEPHWDPDFARGRELLDSKLAKRHRSLKWIAVAAACAAVCVAVLVLPGTRALAQELWYRFVLK